MKFKTVSEYDDEIRMYDTMSDIFKKYIKEYSEEIGGELDYIFLQYILDELKKDGVSDSLSKCWILKTTTQTFGITYNDIIVFDKDWEIVDCLVNDQSQWYIGILESNQYIVE